MSGRLKDGCGVRATFTLNRAFACVVLLCAMLVLTNCGGGGSGGRPQAAVTPETPQPQQPPPEPVPPPQPPQPPPTQECVPLHDGTCPSVDDFNSRARRLAGTYAVHRNFRSQPALAAVGADRAYAHVHLLEGAGAGAGEGVTIGFIDSGIDTAHRMFAGKSIDEVFLGGASNETGAKSSHGTAVASVAAGIRDHFVPTGPHGVAWDADIAMFAIPVESPGGDYNPISLADSGSADTSWASRFNRVLAWRSGPKRVDILNLSIGYEGIIDDYDEAELRASLGQAIRRDGAGGSH